MLAIIDNYDSFTYNLVQYLRELGQELRVFRNDGITAEELLALQPDHVMISPGPGMPDEAGISLEVTQACAESNLPVLGVCLGHQVIAQAFGGVVVQARDVMHGKVSRIFHNGKSLFSGLANPFQATRYHSLVVEKAGLPECLEVTAWTEAPDGTIDDVMGVRHKSLAIQGVQFHPEAILTQHGHDLLRNFLQ